MKARILCFASFLFILLCGIYSLGMLDFLKTKSVVNKQIGQNDFTYTGKLLEERFVGDGVILYNDRRYDCAFRKGDLHVVKFRDNAETNTFEFYLDNGVVKNAYLINNDRKDVFFNGDNFVKIAN